MQRNLIIQLKSRNKKPRRGANSSYSFQIVVTFNRGKFIKDCIGVFYFEGNQQFIHINQKKLAYWLKNGASIKSKAEWAVHFLAYGE